MHPKSTILMLHPTSSFICHASPGMFPNLLSLPKLYLSFKAQLKANVLYKIFKHPCPQGFLSQNFSCSTFSPDLICTFKCTFSIHIIHSYTSINTYTSIYIYICIYFSYVIAIIYKYYYVTCFFNTLTIYVGDLSL